MASISSLSSINGLNLWLDATDLSTFVTSLAQNDVLQWNDKSSNAYQFVPIRIDSRPIISTSRTSSVAVLFNQTSSFHLLSKQKIPANSTLDFFAVLTPYSLWGPRQPIFDSADITVAETDTRFNTQIYADGNEFFRSITSANTYPPNQNFPGYGVASNWPNAFQGTAIYKGNLFVGQSLDLYTATNSMVQGISLCNYLQIYNRKIRQFEIWNYPIGDMNTKALAVYDNKLFVATYSTLSVFYPGASNFAMPSTFMSTTFGAANNNTLRDTFDWNTWFFGNQCNAGTSGGGPLCVYKRDLYAATYGGWLANYQMNSGTLAQCNWTPQLYKWSTATSTINLVTHLRYSWTNQGNSGNWYFQFNRSLMPFRGDMYITGQIYNQPTTGFMFRFNNQYGATDTSYFNNYSITNATSYASIYYGSMILPIDNQSQRFYKYGDNVIQNFGRVNFNNGAPYLGNRQEYSAGAGGMCTYKGSLWLQRATQIIGSNTYGANYVEIFTGPTGGQYSNATVKTAGPSPTNCNTANLMIVHDGKLFLNAFSSNVIYEWGNGTSLDQPFSTLVGAPILLHIRKTPIVSQMYLNGILVENQATPLFTFADQPAREMWVGGAAGTMAAGMSDPGSDHMEGAIHTIVQYNQILSTLDRQKVEGILAWTYGIQNILPASHPYRNSRP
jgi:hypothetical protein